MVQAYRNCAAPYYITVLSPLLILAGKGAFEGVRSRIRPTISARRGAICCAMRVSRSLSRVRMPNAPSVSSLGEIFGARRGRIGSLLRTRVCVGQDRQYGHAARI